jgi:hypothetical protein
MTRYPYINGTQAGNNVMYFFTYANQVTSGLFVLFMVIAFWLVILVTSMVMQLRFTSRIRPEVSFLASSFATFGFAVLLEQFTGTLSPVYFIALLVLTALCFIWVVMSKD